MALLSSWSVEKTIPSVSEPSVICTLHPNIPDGMCAKIWCVDLSAGGLKLFLIREIGSTATHGSISLMWKNVAWSVSFNCWLTDIQRPSSISTPSRGMTTKDGTPQREGVNIGRYAQTVMRQAGHKWTDLGHMESHVRLKNANTGKSQIMAVNHPGGGPAYALSYRPQKIVESLEGGEKPAIMLIGTLSQA